MAHDALGHAADDEVAQARAPLRTQDDEIVRFCFGDDGFGGHALDEPHVDVTHASPAYVDRELVELPLARGGDVTEQGSRGALSIIERGPPGMQLLVVLMQVHVQQINNRADRSSKGGGKACRSCGTR